MSVPYVDKLMGVIDMGIKFLWRTDVHFADNTPLRRTGSWLEDVSKKLEWVGQKGQELGVDFVIDGGDFFDVKSPHRNSHNLVRAASQVHKDNYPMPVYALVGNHDVKYGNIDYLPEQPLGVLFASGVFEQFGGEEKEIVLEKDGIKVKVVGIPYHGTSYDWDVLRNVGSRKGDADYFFVCCHLLASVKGGVGAMYEGEDIVPYSELEGKGIDAWFFGHWHKDQGITELSDGTVVVNVGSLTRGALHLDDMDREPCVVEVACSSKKGEKVTVNRHNVPVRSVFEAFKVEDKLDELEEKERMEEVVERMKAVFREGEESKQLSLIDRVRTLSIPNPVRERAILYLEQSEPKRNEKLT